MSRSWISNKNKGKHPLKAALERPVVAEAWAKNEHPEWIKRWLNRIPPAGAPPALLTPAPAARSDAVGSGTPLTADPPLQRHDSFPDEMPEEVNYMPLPDTPDLHVLIMWHIFVPVPYTVDYDQFFNTSSVSAVHGSF